MFWILRNGTLIGTEHSSFRPITYLLPLRWQEALCKEEGLGYTVPGRLEIDFDTQHVQSTTSKH